MEPRTIRLEGFEGIHLVADVWGADTDWPVLFMHGGGQTRHAWGKTAEILAGQGWKAVTLDLRGHGDSEWSEKGDYSFTSLAADCIAVCDELGKAPVLVGASMGGVTAILAEGGSDRDVAAALVVVDITGRANPEGVERIRTFMESGFDGFATLDDAAAAIAAYTPNRPKRVNPAGLMKVLRQRADGRWYWHWDPKMLSRAQQRGAAARAGGSFRGRIERHPRADAARARRRERHRYRRGRPRLPRQGPQLAGRRRRRCIAHGRR